MFDHTILEDAHQNQILDNCNIQIAKKKRFSAVVLILDMKKNPAEKT